MGRIPDEKIAEWKARTEQANTGRLAWIEYGEEARRFVPALLAEREEMLREREQAEHAAKVALAANEAWSQMAGKTVLKTLNGTGLTFEFRDGRLVCQEHEAALSVLREVEWAADHDEDPGYCPVCHHPEHHTHEQDCRLEALLK